MVSLFFCCPDTLGTSMRKGRRISSRRPFIFYIKLSKAKSRITAGNKKEAGATTAAPASLFIHAHCLAEDCGL